MTHMPSPEACTVTSSLGAHGAGQPQSAEKTLGQTGLKTGHEGKTPTATQQAPSMAVKAAMAYSQQRGHNSGPDQQWGVYCATQKG